MIFYYGTKSVHLKTKKSNTLTCPNCNSQGTLITSVYRSHAHLYWIPFFPTRKIGISQCQNCDSVFKYKEMPELLKRECDRLKSESKGPIWQFSGLALIGFLIALSIVGIINEQGNEEEYLSSPKAGDVYEYKTNLGDYSTLKVISVSNDSVFVSPNEYAISKSHRLYKIDKKKNYSKYTYGISRQELKSMYESKIIFDINR